MQTELHSQNYLPDTTVKFKTHYILSNFSCEVVGFQSGSEILQASLRQSLNFVVSFVVICIRNYAGAGVHEVPPKRRSSGIPLANF